MSDTGPWLEYYGSINNGAHRQAADLVGAPAFIWHQAFWNPVPVGERDDRARRIANYIRNVRSNIGQRMWVAPQLSRSIEVGGDDRATAITLSFIWQEMPAKVRFEIHTEYISITSIIDASIKMVDNPNNGILKEVDKNLNLFVKRTLKVDDATKLSFPECAQVYNFIYRDLWESYFFDEVINVHDKICRGDVGKKFADFRGFVTSETYDCKKSETGISDRNIFEYCPIQRPFYRNDEGARGQLHRTSYPHEKWARDRLDSVWQFLTVAVQDDSPFLTGRTEFTASRILDGRMLYVSALGPQPREGTHGNEQPLHFYLHSVTQCERQLGRVVDRLTRLGTLRLAAIIAVPALKTVGRTLEEIQGDIVAARNEIHELIQLAQNRADLSGLTGAAAERYEVARNRALKAKETEILSKIQDMQRRMQNLSDGKTKPLPDGKYLGKASVEYRLLRSTYYKKQFYEAIKGLRIKRIEGYQKYDDFVNRRMGSAFGFIDAVERRIEQVKAEWGAVDQLYLTTAVTILTGQLNKEQSETGKIQRSIKSIQIGGELLLFWFILPYYLSNLVADVADCEHNAWCSDAHWGVGSGHKIIVMAVWALGFLGGIFSLIDKLSSRSRR